MNGPLKRYWFSHIRLVLHIPDIRLFSLTNTHDGLMRGNVKFSIIHSQGNSETYGSDNQIFDLWKGAQIGCQLHLCSNNRLLVHFIFDTILEKKITVVNSAQPNTPSFLLFYFESTKFTRTCIINSQDFNKPFENLSIQGQSLTF